MGHRTEKLIAMSEPTSAARVALITGASGGLGRALVAVEQVRGEAERAGEVPREQLLDPATPQGTRLAAIVDALHRRAA